MRHGRQVRCPRSGARRSHADGRAAGRGHALRKNQLSPRRMEIAKGARRPKSPFAAIEDAVAAIRAGRIVIVCDDENRENEGDLTIAAEKITPEAINFMARYGRGLICLAIAGRRLDELQIPMMVQENTSALGTAFTVSVEARHGVTTGISAADRATTIKTMVDPRTRPEDLVRPGHTFPLRARDGGVLVRAGQ